jgi:hypothetical protein
MKAVLFWLVRWALVLPAQEIFILPWLLLSAQYNIFFPHRTLFTFFVPIAQQAGQAVVQGRLSLKSSYLSLRATCSLNAAKHILYNLFCHIRSLKQFFIERLFYVELTVCSGFS